MAKEEVKKIAQLRSSADRIVQQGKQRIAQYASLKSRAKKTAVIIVVAAFLAAGISDILSLFQIELNLLTSWLIPAIVWLIVRRINVMNDTGQKIQSAHQDALQTARILRQRLRPQLLASGQTKLLVGIERIQAGQFVSSYVKTFVRDTVISQVAELIPILNFLPTYIGQVVKVLRDQRTAYKKIQEALVPYQKTLSLLEQLDAFQLQIIAVQIQSLAQPTEPERAAPSRPTQVMDIQSKTSPKRQRVEGKSVPSPSLNRIRDVMPRISPAVAI